MICQTSKPSLTEGRPGDSRLGDQELRRSRIAATNAPSIEDGPTAKTGSLPGFRYLLPDPCRRQGRLPPYLVSRMRTLMSIGLAVKGAVATNPATPQAAYAPAFCGLMPPAAMIVRRGSIPRSRRTSPSN